MARDDHAIVIGITRYPRYGNLEGPENDAVSFRDWLESSSGGNVPGVNITTLITSTVTSGGDCPKIGDMDDAFDHLIENGTRRGGRLGRRLYLFCAGHGISPDYEETLLLAANARRDRLGEHLPGRAYAKLFVTGAFFDEVVLFMDCCRDADLRVSPRIPPWQIQPGNRPVRTFFGFATRWPRKAREAAMPPDNKVRGLFTAALLHGLTKARPDGNGRVTGSALEGYVYNFMTSGTNEVEKQEPRFDYDRNNDIVFKEIAVSPLPTVTALRKIPAVISFDPPDPNASVELRDGDFQLVESRQGAAEPWSVSLLPGFYSVSIVASSRGKLFEVVGGKRNSVDV